MCKVDLISFYLDIINIINTLATTNDYDESIVGLSDH
jgi:hypothetical protein